MKKILTRDGKPTDELQELVTKVVKGIKVEFTEVYYLDFDVNEFTGTEGKTWLSFILHLRIAAT